MNCKLILIFLFCLFSQTLSQINCNFGSCNTCIAVHGCGWCAPTQQCLNGDQHGPTNSTCIGDSWQWANCIDCTSLPDCRSCLDHSSDCSWCETPNNASLARCLPLGAPNCPYAPTSCPCYEYSTCSTCTYSSRGQCKWCADEKNCHRTNSSCPGSQTCPCTDNPDCSSCSTTFGCFWCFQDGTCRTNNDPTCRHEYGGCDAYCRYAGGAGCNVCRNLRGCGWCVSQGTQGQCHDLNYATCQIANSCPIDCTPYKSCETCLPNRDCVWCPTSSSCVPSTTASATCPKNTYSCGIDQVLQNAGFSGSSFVGGMFLVIGVLSLGLIGYCIYRWKVSKSGTYTELK